MSKEKQLILLIILLIIPCFFAFSKSEPVLVGTKEKLNNVLAHIEGYKVVGNTPLTEDVYNFLDLDDYTFTTYEKDGIRLTLYIGFYYTSEKISAAHSPLVCFPGQGWTITEPVSKTIKVANHSINYSQIEANLGENKELVTYWYQSDDNTAPQIYRNKLNNFYNKLFKNDPQHAFVRISVPLNSIGPERANRAIINFSKTFYPLFLDFITSISEPT